MKKLLLILIIVGLAVYLTWDNEGKTTTNGKEF